MKGVKVKKSIVGRPSKNETCASKGLENDGPNVTTEMNTVQHTLSFGTERQRKVFPTRSLTIHKTDLHKERIHIISNVLLPEECEYFINWGENQGFEEFKQAQSREYAHRENGRIQAEDAILAQRIYERIVSWLPLEIDRLCPKGCSSNIRLYRYTEGQSFGKHIDEAHIDKSLNGVTKYTLLIYLSGHANSTAISSVEETDSNDSISGTADDIDTHTCVTCTGGETVFYKGHSSNQVLLSVAPEQGKMLLHGHGAKCLTHEGSAVTGGVKYVLRTDVVYG